MTEIGQREKTFEKILFFPTKIYVKLQIQCRRIYEKTTNVISDVIIKCAGDITVRAR